VLRFNVSDVLIGVFRPRCGQPGAGAFVLCGWQIAGLQAGCGWSFSTVGGRGLLRCRSLSPHARWYVLVFILVGISSAGTTHGALHAGDGLQHATESPDLQSASPHRPGAVGILGPRGFCAVAAMAGSQRCLLQRQIACGVGRASVAAIAQCP